MRESRRPRRDLPTVATFRQRTRCRFPSSPVGMTLGMAPTQNLPEVVNVRVGAMAPIIARGLVGVLATDPRLRVVDPEPDDSLLVAAVLREQPDVIVLGEAVAPELLSSIKEGCSLAADRKSTRLNSSHLGI